MMHWNGVLEGPSRPMTARSLRAGEPALLDTVRPWLRLEGLAALVLGVALYVRLGGDWLWLVPLLVAADLSLVGYLGGPRLGSVIYNLGHNWVIGLAALGLGAWLAIPVLQLVGAMLIAHVGMDRVIGFGLRHPDDEKRTHLQRA
jgi:hypothetical protein